MSYRKHPSNIPNMWVIDYRPNGRNGERIRENFEGTEEQAKEYERHVRQIHVSLAKTSANPPFKEIASEFVTWAEQYRKPNYVRSIKCCLKSLLLAFGM